MLKAEIISQPYSGEYSEKVYDNKSPWNSRNWTFIKFINDDYFEWCGHFRGFPQKVAISKLRNLVLVLTSDYLYQLDSLTGNLINIEDQPQYTNLTVSPNGDFILADDYHLAKVTSSIKTKELIKSPISMDTIEFKNWNNSKLEFTCDEFLNWDRHLTMTFDSETNQIEILNG